MRTASHWLIWQALGTVGRMLLVVIDVVDVWLVVDLVVVLEDRVAIEGLGVTVVVSGGFDCVVDVNEVVIDGVDVVFG